MAKLQSGTRIYGTANVDSSLAVGGNVYVLGTLVPSYITLPSGLSISANVFSANTANITNTLSVGTANGLPLTIATNPIVSVVGNSNNYIQTYQINYSNTQYASSDIIAYPNNGNDSNGWIDMGITSNVFSHPTYSVTGRNEGYIFMSAPGGSGTSGNLVIATDSTGTYNAIEFVVGGFNKGKTNSNVRITSASSSSSNTTGSLIVSGGIGVTGNVYVSGLLSSNNVTSNTYYEGVVTPSISTNTLTLNLAMGGVFNVALNANITTLTIQNPPASGTSGGFVLIFTADGTARSVTWPASVKWPDGSAPSLTTTNTKKDVFTFFTIDGGTTWNGFTSGQGI